MTQIEAAKSNRYTREMKIISKVEGVGIHSLRERISQGKIVIPLNKKRKISRICGIGYGLTTKVNANLGTSPYQPTIKNELKKLAIAIEYGADTIMDLSVGGNLREIRREMIKHCPVPIGTVPIYEAAVNAQRKYGSFLKMNAEDMFEVLEQQADDGIDFFTIHAGVTQKNLSLLHRKKRITGIVSRGGSILACWMKTHNRENPFFESFDRVLDIAKQYDITLSLGDGLRPGSIFDSNDQAQEGELFTLGELTKHARREFVQIIIEGPGHVRLDKIRDNVLLEKRVCQGAPFYVLGPLVTDIACGYDHIASAIGGAIAASYGADFLCFVTPSEHLRLPRVFDVKEGVIASRIAAHSSDLVKGIRSALDWDRDMSISRGRRNWKKQIRLSLDPGKSRCFYGAKKLLLDDVCSMCGEYCAIKLSHDKIN
ncbi:MAG: phosphomethylpyrimidine synthase ThiC [Candidatus Omnitrophota bacterium]|jgi:phosphomethylpyrimidine synthase